MNPPEEKFQGKLSTWGQASSQKAYLLFENILFLIPALELTNQCDFLHKYLINTFSYVCTKNCIDSFGLGRDMRKSILFEMIPGPLVVILFNHGHPSVEIPIFFGDGRERIDRELI